MTRRAPGNLAALLAVAVVYPVLGFGYHCQSSACFDSRHASDGDQGALTGTPALVVDVGIWPVFSAFTSADVSCEPLDVGARPFAALP